MNDNIIELAVDGNKELFELLLRFKFKGTDYIALNPKKDEDDSVAIFKVLKADEGEEIYSTISNMNIAKEVFVHFISIWEIMQDDE